MVTAAKGVARGFFAVVAVLAIGVASMFTAALALGATALIVPGTGTPNPNRYPEYVQDARNYYLKNTLCGAPGACDTLGQDLIGIDYPASFWPLTFIPGWCTTDCQKWNVSVAEGVANLETALLAALGSDPQNPVEDVVIFGHSQGAAVVSNTLSDLDTLLTAAQKKRVRVVVTGNVDNPAGGMWSRIGFLGRIPFFDLTTGLPTPTDTGIPFTSIAMQYDGASNAPKYWGNLLSLVNSVAGFAYLHGTTLIPDERTPVGVPDFYPTVEDYLAAVYDPVNARQDDHGNTYIVVPSPILPIVLPFLDIAARTKTTWLVKPVVDLVSPVLRVLIDLGYDANEKPGVYAPLSLLPFSLRTNPFKVAADLVEAVFQGIHDALHGGAPLPVPPKVSLGVPDTVAASRTSASLDGDETTGGGDIVIESVDAVQPERQTAPSDIGGPIEEPTGNAVPDTIEDSDVDEGETTESGVDTTVPDEDRGEGDFDEEASDEEGAPPQVDDTGDEDVDESAADGDTVADDDGATDDDAGDAAA